MMEGDDPLIGCDVPGIMDPVPCAKCNAWAAPCAYPEHYYANCAMKEQQREWSKQFGEAINNRRRNNHLPKGQSVCTKK